MGPPTPDQGQIWSHQPVPHESEHPQRI